MARIVDITVHIHHETEKAWLVSDTGDRDDAVWLPKSVVEVQDKDGFIAEISLPEDMAQEKGLI